MQKFQTKQKSSECLVFLSPLHLNGYKTGLKCMYYMSKKWLRWWGRNMELKNDQIFFKKRQQEVCNASRQHWLGQGFTAFTFAPIHLSWIIFDILDFKCYSVMAILGQPLFIVHINVINLKFKTTIIFSTVEALIICFCVHFSYKLHYSNNASSSVVLVSLV